MTRPPGRGRTPRAAKPQHIVPMRATLASDPPEGAQWAYEFKWEGVRALVHVEDGAVRIDSRSLRDVTHEYPELQPLSAHLGDRDAILDGEIVALDEHGRPSFGRIQQRLGLTAPRVIQARMQEVPVVFMAFDLLHLDGASLLDRPYAERRRALEGLALRGAAWITPPYATGEGRATLEASRALRFEGIVAKRLTSPYRPGTRGADWIKVKNKLSQEFVVGGWTRGEGARAPTLGSLLVGYHVPQGGRRRLVYAGRVGTGFTDASLDQVRRWLAPMETAACPFDPPPPRAATWVEPRLVVEVEFTEWTGDGRLRHPSLKGFRWDKPASEVVRETPVEVADHA